LKVYKLNSNKPIDYITQNGFFLPKKYFSEKQDNFLYKNDDNLNNIFLTDENINTFLELDTINKNTIVLSLDKKLNI
jgi:hypothetical protein